MASIEHSDSGLPLGREARLLLATAGGEGLDTTIQELASASLDWEAFVVLVLQERAEAIVSARLGRVGAPVPASIRDTLRGLATRSDLRMAMLSHRLDQTIAAFAESGVPVLLLKGAALGRTVYGSLPRRPMLDLDLLVPVDQRHAAREVALGLGWVAGDMERKVEFYEGHYHLAPLHDGQGRNFNLEIHSALFAAGHPFDWPVEALWNRSRPLPHSPARVPSPEDLLLHTALHFMWSHAAQFGPWRTFRDIRVMAEDPDIDWDLFTRQARASRGATAASWALRLARRLAGAAVPSEVERALQPALPAAVLAMLDRHFAGQWFAADAICPSRRLGRWLWRLAVQPQRSGHGQALPWDREALFRQHDAGKAPETTGHKVLRHLRSPGRYFRYLHRITVGAGR